jgi:EpsI family protein
MTPKAILAAVILLVGGVAGNYLRFVEPMPDRAPSFSEIPMETGNYFGEEHRFSEQSYEVLQADTTTLRLYHSLSGERIWLFIGYFASQKYGSQIHSPRHCLPGSGWRIRTIEPYRLELADGVTKEINRLVIAERNSTQLMLYWYETRGGSIRSEYGLKWDLMMNSLRLRPTDAAMIRLNLPLFNTESVEAATQRAITWLNEYYRPIEQSLPFVSTNP